MQNLVADTATRALLRFIKERNQRGLRSRIMMSLYDAMTAIAPFEQAKETIEVLKNCMTIWTPWTVHGRTFNFDVDVSVGFRWGVKPTDEEKEIIKKYI